MNCSLELNDSILAHLLGKKKFDSYEELTKAFQDNIVDPGGIIPLRVEIKFGPTKRGQRDNFGKIYTEDGKIRMTLVLPKSTEHMDRISLMTAQGSSDVKKYDTNEYAVTESYIEFKDINEFVSFYMADFMHVGRENILDRVSRTSWILRHALGADNNGKVFAKNNFRVDKVFIQSLAKYGKFLLEELESLKGTEDWNIEFSLTADAFRSYLSEVTEALSTSAERNEEIKKQKETKVFRPIESQGVVSNLGALSLHAHPKALSADGANASQAGRQVLLLSLEQKAREGNLRVVVQYGSKEHIQDVSNLTDKQIAEGVVGVPEVFEDGQWKRVYLTKDFNPKYPNRKQALTTNPAEAYSIDGKIQMYFFIPRDTPISSKHRAKLAEEGSYVLPIANVQSWEESGRSKVPLRKVRVFVSEKGVYPKSGQLQYYDAASEVTRNLDRTTLSDKEIDEMVMPLLNHTYDDLQDMREAVTYLNNLVSVSQEYLDELEEKGVEKVPSREISFYVGSNGRIVVKPERVKFINSDGSEGFTTLKNISKEDYNPSNEEQVRKVRASLQAARVRIPADITGAIDPTITQVTIQNGRVIAETVTIPEFYEDHIVLGVQLDDNGDIIKSDVRMFSKVEQLEKREVDQNVGLTIPNLNETKKPGDEITYSGVRQIASFYPNDPLAKMLYALIDRKRAIPNVKFVDGKEMKTHTNDRETPAFYDGTNIYVNLSVVRTMPDLLQVLLEESVHHIGDEVFNNPTDPRVQRLKESWQLVQSRAEAVLVNFSADDQVIVRHHLGSIEEFAAGFVRKEFIAFLDKVDGTLTEREQKKYSKGFWKTLVDTIRDILTDWFGSNTKLTKAVVEQSLDILFESNSSKRQLTKVITEQPFSKPRTEEQLASVSGIDSVFDPEDRLGSTEETIKPPEPTKPAEPTSRPKFNVKKKFSAPLTKLDVATVKTFDALFAESLFGNVFTPDDNNFVNFVEKSFDSADIAQYFKDYLDSKGYDVNDPAFIITLVKWGQQSKVFKLSEDILSYADNPDGQPELSEEEQIIDETSKLNEGQAVTHDRTEQKKSSFEVADAKVRAFIKMTPQLELWETPLTGELGFDYLTTNWVDETGETRDYWLKIIRDERGNPVLTDYTSLWNKIQFILKDSLTFEEMLVKLTQDQDVATNHPEAYLVGLRLAQLDDSFQSMQFKNSFKTAFSRVYVPTFILDRRMEEGKPVQTTFQLAGTIDRTKIETSFFNDFYHIVEEKFSMENEDGFKYIDTKKLWGYFSTPGASVFELWSGLGFPISQEMEESIDFENSLTNIQSSLNTRLIQLFNNQILIPTVEVANLIKKNYYAEGQFNIQGRNTEWNSLLNLASNMSDLTTSNMVKNAEGENQSNLHIWSSFTIQLERIKRAFSTVGLKREQALQLAGQFVPRVLNPLFKNSLTYRNITSSNLPQAVNISGTRTYDGQDYKGTSTISLSQLEYEHQQMFTILNYGISEILRAETANTSLGVMFKWENQSPTPIAVKDFKLTVAQRDKVAKSGGTEIDLLSIQTEGDAKVNKIFLDYLRGELEQIRLEAVNPLNYWKTKQTNKDKLTLWGFLSDGLKAKLDPNNIEESIKKNNGELVAELQTFLNNKIKDRLRQFEKNTGARFNMRHPVFTTSNLKETANDLHHLGLFKAYYFNHLILNIEHIILSHGDLSQFDKFYKRAKSNISSGTPVFTDAKFFANLNSQDVVTFTEAVTGEKPDYYTYREVATANSMIMKEDLGTLSEQQAKELKDGVNEALKLQSKEYGTTYPDNFGQQVVDSYNTKMEITDGEAVIHPDFYRMLLMVVGSWSIEREEGYKYKVYKMLDKLTEEEEEFVEKVEIKIIDNGGPYWTFPKVKFQMKGNYLAPGNVALEGLDKFSLTCLWPDSLEGKKGLSMFKMMTDGNIGYAKFQSTTKIATFTPDDILGRINAGDLNVNVEESPLTSTHKVIVENLKEQVKTADEYSTSSRFGTQQNKLIVSNLMVNGKYVGGLANAVNTWKGAQRLIAQKERDQLIKNLKYKDGKIDLKAFADLVKQSLEKRELPESMSAIFEFFGQEYYDKFEAALSPQLVETLLYSVLQKRIKDKNMPGYQMIQVSSPLFDSYGKRDLNFYRMVKENGKLKVLPAECKITLMGDFKNLLNLDEVLEEYQKQFPLGQPSYYDELNTKRKILNTLLQNAEFVSKHEKVLTVYSYRIPTQGFNSMDVMIVKEFLPTEEGPMIVPPPEIVKKSGTDYDHDKMPTVFPSINEYGGYIKSPSKELETLTYGQYLERKAALLEQKDKIFKKETPESQERARLALENNELYDQNKMIIFLLDDESPAAEVEATRKAFPSLDISKKELKKLLNDNSLKMKENKKTRQAIYAEHSKELTEIFEELQDLRDSRTNLKRIQSNRMIESAKSILLHPINFARLVTPNSTGLIRPVFEEILELKGISQVEPTGFRVVDPLTHLEKWWSVKQKDNLGIGAQANTLYTLLQDAQVKLGKVFYIRAGDQKIPIQSNFSVGKTNELSNPFLIDGEGKVQEKLQYINEYINLTVDAASDDIAGYTNLHQYNAGLILFELMQGIPLRNTMMLVEQPGVIFLDKLTERYMFEGMTRSQAEKQALWEIFDLGSRTDIIYNPQGELLSEGKQKQAANIWLAKEMSALSTQKAPDMNALVGRVKDNVSILATKDVTEHDRKAILTYLILQRKSEKLREFKSLVGFDTSMPTNLMATLDLLNNLKDVEYTGLFTPEDYFKIRDESTIAHTYTADLFENFSKAIFSIKRSPMFMAKSLEMGENVYLGKDKETFYRDFDNDYLLSIVQNFGDISEEELFDLISTSESNKTLYDSWEEVRPEVEHLSIYNRLRFSVSPTTLVGSPMFVMGMENSAEDWDQVTQDARAMLKHPDKKVREFAANLIKVGVSTAGFSIGPYYLMKGLPHEEVVPIISKAMAKFNELSQEEVRTYIEDFADEFLKERGMRYSPYFVKQLKEKYGEDVNINSEFKNANFNTEVQRFTNYHYLYFNPEQVVSDENLISHYERLGNTVDELTATMQEIKDNRYPQAELDSMIRKQKYTPASIKKELNLPIGTDKDINPSVSSAKGKSIETVAEELSEYFAEQGVEFDSQDIRNQIIEYIKDPKSPTIEAQVKSDLKSKTKEFKDMEKVMKERGLLGLKSAPLTQEQEQEETCRIDFNQPPI